MNGEPRGHHIFSKFYLEGFTIVKNKDFRFVVFKLENKEILYNQTPLKFGKQRDFNRVDIPGVAPNILEIELGNFETIAAEAIRNILKDCCFKNKDRAIILNLMALFAVRSIMRREQWNNILTYVVEIILSKFASAEEGTIINGLLITTEIKETLKKVYFIAKAQNNSHIAREFHGINVILPCLFFRKWTLLITPDDMPFITSDHPVCLIWKIIICINRTCLVLVLVVQIPKYFSLCLKIWL